MFFLYRWFLQKFYVWLCVNVFVGGTCKSDRGKTTFAPVFKIAWVTTEKKNNNKAGVAPHTRCCFVLRSMQWLMLFISYQAFIAPDFIVSKNASYHGLKQIRNVSCLQYPVKTGKNIGLVLVLDFSRQLFTVMYSNI